MSQFDKNETGFECSDGEGAENESEIVNESRDMNQSQDSDYKPVKKEEPEESDEEDVPLVCYIILCCLCVFSSTSCLNIF